MGCYYLVKFKFNNWEGNADILDKRIIVWADSFDDAVAKVVKDYDDNNIFEINYVLPLTYDCFTLDIDDELKGEI